jgi:hypothetical protein
MRSDLVFEALVHTSNRYELCKLVSKASRECHGPRTRLEDTTSDVLVLVGRTTPAGKIDYAPVFRTQQSLEVSGR